MGRTRIESALSITPERAARLARLIRLISKTPRSRNLLLDKLDVDLRGFYRDVKMLRELNIQVANRGDLYSLAEEASEARAKLRCPDPLLTIGELTVLARGSTDTHRKLKRLLESIVGSTAASNGYHKQR